jgi:hypothetical protein
VIPPTEKRYSEFFPQVETADEVNGIGNGGNSDHLSSFIE